MAQRLEALKRWAPVVVQVVLGATFAMHGAQKMFGAFNGPGPAGVAAFFAKLGLEPSALWAWVVAITEFVGGLCLIVGLLTRVWAAGLVIDMTVAILKVRLPKGFFAGGGGMEFELALWALALVLFLYGPSFLSLDRALGIEREP